MLIRASSMPIALLAACLWMLGACGHDSDGATSTPDAKSHRDAGSGPPTGLEAGAADMGFTGDGVGGKFYDASNGVQLRQLLRDALPGDSVSVRQGTYKGPLTVPAGVTLQGDGSGRVVIEGPPKDACVLVETDPEAGPTVVRNVTLRAKRGAALAIAGKGELEGQELEIEVEAGVGIAAEGPRRIMLKNVAIRGTQALGPLRDKAFPLSGRFTPVIGLLLSKIEQLELEQLSITGFAGYGALLHDCKGSWKQGGVEQTVGVGLQIAGGQLALENVKLAGNLASRQPSALVAAALVLSGDAVVTTTGLVVLGNGGIGVLHGAAVSVHDESSIWNNERVGLRLQGGEATLRKAGFTGNHGAGLLLRDGGRLELTASTVSGTLPLLVREGATPGFATPTLGDGLHLMMGTKPTQMVLRDVSFVDNARSGCLLHGTDPGARSRAIQIENVSISGKGYGLVAQGGMGLWSVWDYQIGPEMADPPTQAMATANPVAVPSVNGLSAGVLNADSGLIQNGTVHVRITNKGLDPGLGP